MSRPIISVVMSVHNGGDYLQEAIESILNQTFNSFEFLIVDDGSTDKSLEIIASYDDKRIVLIKNEMNLGLSISLNKGIKLAKGKYIARMDADDISFPERFEKQVKFLEGNPDIDLCGTWFKVFGKKEYTQKLPIQHNQIKSDLLFYTPIAHPTVMMKRTIFDKHKYSEKFLKAQDYALWVELINNFKFANISEPLLYYRMHPSQTSSAQSDTQQKSMLKALSLFLKKMDSTLSDTSRTLHEQLVLRNIVSLNETEKWLNSLIQQNIETQFFENTSLQRSLFGIWKSQAFAQTVYGLSTWMKFYSSSLYLPKQLTLSMHIKFTIKCLFHYSRKH